MDAGNYNARCENKNTLQKLQTGLGGKTGRSEYAPWDCTTAWSAKLIFDQALCAKPPEGFIMHSGTYLKSQPMKQIFKREICIRITHVNLTRTIASAWLIDPAFGWCLMIEEMHRLLRIYLRTVIRRKMKVKNEVTRLGCHLLVKNNYISSHTGWKRSILRSVLKRYLLQVAF